MVNESKNGATEVDCNGNENRTKNWTKFDEMKWGKIECWSVFNLVDFRAGGDWGLSINDVRLTQ